MTGSGSVTSATQNITGINVSSLSNGTLTYSVTLTNAAGNTGTAATATATLATGSLSGIRESLPMEQGSPGSPCN